MPTAWTDPARERLAFLLETVALEAEHLQATDQRLFAVAFTPGRATPWPSCWPA